MWAHLFQVEQITSRFNRNLSKYMFPWGRRKFKFRLLTQRNSSRSDRESMEKKVEQSNSLFYDLRGTKCSLSSWMFFDQTSLKKGHKKTEPSVSVPFVCISYPSIDNNNNDLVSIRFYCTCLVELGSCPWLRQRYTNFNEEETDSRSYSGWMDRLMLMSIL